LVTKKEIRRGAWRNGFTLLELILVVTVTGVLVVVSFAGYTQMVQSAALTSAADVLRDAFTEARQDAMTQNMTVEVRIYALPSGDGMTSNYVALQLHGVKSDGTTPALGAPLFLGSSVVIDATLAHSTLIAANTLAATPDASDSRLNGQTRVFHFMPDGSTDLDAASQWFLTVRAATQSDPTRFPTNWACVKVDPATGRATIFRP
jgi:uncharacterized protein (TIGR02596 family)